MSIPIKTKDKVLGETFNIGELIEALNSEVFTTDDAPISITTEDYTGDLVAVYQCANCKAVHLLGNNHFLDGKPAFTKEDISEFLAYGVTNVLGFQESINKKDLLLIIGSIDKDTDVIMETMADDGSYTVTGVYKCSEECPAIHLDSAYSEYDFSQN